MNRWMRSLLIACTTLIGACADYQDAESIVDDLGPELRACESLTRPVFHRLKPSRGSVLLTISESEAQKASTNYGYTEDLGVSFRAAGEPANGISPVYRLYNPKLVTHFWTIDANERTSAMTKYGFTVDEGIGFYASRSASDCLVPVYRLYSSTHKLHRFATEADHQKLVEAGWKSEGIRFYAAPPSATSTPEPTPDVGTAPPPPSTTTPPDTDTVFTIVAIPDTQREVAYYPSRFDNRMSWLAANKSALDIRFITQIGDLVDWDTPDHIQYVRASNGLKTLDSAGMPYAIAIGNHDTAAVCPGGSACPGDVRANLRDTRTFNTYFPTTRFRNFAGSYETNKIDNAFHTFRAGGLDWLVLNMELWPRAGAVAWARGVIERHPRHNVIMITHMHLSADGSIGTSNGGYGDNSPRYVYDNLLKLYPNVRMVFSGHTGTTAFRVDTGNHGNKIYNFLQTYHDGTTNPTRLLEIDTAKGTIKTRVYSPLTDAQKNDGSAFEVTGINWVR